MSDTNDQIRAENKTTSRSYNPFDGDKLAATILHEYEADRIMFTRADVEPGFRGHGVRSGLARQALDDVRAQTKTLSNYREYAGRFIDEHPADDDVVDNRHPGFLQNRAPRSETPPGTDRQ
jgi:predicted GNAT family acetyltransferase